MPRWRRATAVTPTAVNSAPVYRTDTCPAVQAYAGIYERFRAGGGDVDFSQVVLAQQTLSQATRDYLDVLFDAWQATAELSELLQVDDVYSMDGLARAGADITHRQLRPPQP